MGPKHNMVTVGDGIVISDTNISSERELNRFGLVGFIVRECLVPNYGTLPCEIIGQKFCYLARRVFIHTLTPGRNNLFKR